MSKLITVDWDGKSYNYPQYSNIGEIKSDWESEGDCYVFELVSETDTALAYDAKFEDFEC